MFPKPKRIGFRNRIIGYMEILTYFLHVLYIYILIEPDDPLKMKFVFYGFIAGCLVLSLKFVPFVIKHSKRNDIEDYNRKLEMYEAMRDI